MNIYTNDGWLDVPKLIRTAERNGIAFVMITGARGTGKTYGTLEDSVISNKLFIYMRRTATELDAIAQDDSLNPFNKLNTDHGWNIGLVKSSKYTYAIVDRDVLDDGTISKSGRYLGLAVALSTIANIRGFDAQEFERIFYDEFIPEPHARKIKEEHFAFLNAYETINRNRELDGRPPVMCICASNSNKLDNPLYLGLGLVAKVDKMKRNKQSTSIMPKKSLMLVNMEDSPISAKKADTALYRMSHGTGFERMALSNEYIGEEERRNIGSQPLAEYIPLCVVGELCIYRHKSKRRWYMSTHTTGTPPEYGYGENELKRFRKSYGWLWARYLEDCVYFESPMCEILYTNHYMT